MRVVVQRVSQASVEVENRTVSEIGPGLLILLGIEDEDDQEDLQWLSKKISNLRIFNDDDGNMNLSLTEVGGEVMVVSQFTLHGSVKKGNRPSFIRASKPDFAVPMYEKFVQYLGALTGQEVKTGKFGAYMKVSLLNDGPVTLFIDSKNRE